MSQTIPTQSLDTEDDMIHMFTNNMNVTWCLQVTIVDVEQNLTRHGNVSAHREF